MRSCRPRGTPVGELAPPAVHISLEAKLSGTVALLSLPPAL